MEYLGELGKGPEGKSGCAVSIGGISFSIPSVLRSAKRSGGQKRKTSEEQKKPPPQLRKDNRLMIAGNLVFLPGL
jgi:hypothetical protein